MGACVVGEGGLSPSAVWLEEKKKKTQGETVRTKLRRWARPGTHPGQGAGSRAFREGQSTLNTLLPAVRGHSSEERKRKTNQDM